MQKKPYEPPAIRTLGEESEPYPCLMCQTRAERVDAEMVATAADGLQWFECGEHEPSDNIAGVVRTRLESIADWRAANLARQGVADSSSDEQNGTE
jgi:hypothetical protein